MLVHITAIMTSRISIDKIEERVNLITQTSRNCNGNLAELKALVAHTALDYSQHIAELHALVTQTEFVPGSTNDTFRIPEDVVGLLMATITCTRRRNRLRTWTPRTHFTFPPAVQARIMTGELVFLRLRDEGIRIPIELRQLIWSFITPND